jgi:hypothetical protein
MILTSISSASFACSNSLHPDIWHEGHAPYRGVLRDVRSPAPLTDPLLTSLLRIAFIGASFATSIWQILLAQGVAFGIGLGFLFTGSVGLPPQWFSKRRSLANGLSAGGSGLGGLTYSLATDAMIRNVGLAWTFRILGVICFVVCFTCSVVVRDRNKAVGAIHVAFHKGLFVRFEYYLLVLWAVFSLLGYNIVNFVLPDFAHTVGFTRTQGSLLASLFNCKDSIISNLKQRACWVS